MKFRTFDQIIAGLLTLAVLAFVYFYMLNIVFYFALAWVFSMIGRPVMDFIMDKLRFRRLKAGASLAAVAVILLFLLIFGMFFIIILPPLINQVEVLANLDYNLVFESLQKPIDEVRQFLLEYGVIKKEDVDASQARDIIMRTLDFGGISDIFSNLFNIASNFLIGFGAIVFVTFFFLRDSSIFTSIIVAIVPENYSEQTQGMINEISSLLKRYFGGIAVQMLILFLFVYIVLSLFRIKDALIIAFFAAFLNLIPYIGPVIGAAFGILIVFTNYIGFDFYHVILNRIIIVGVTFIAMQTIDNYIIQPMIYSEKIRAHPLEIFVVVLVGAKVYGIIGMVLAIPFFVVLRAIAGVFFSQYRLVRKIAKKD